MNPRLAGAEGRPERRMGAAGGAGDGVIDAHRHDEQHDAWGGQRREGHPVWDDGCCWLKTACGGRVHMQGKRAVLVSDSENGTDEELWDTDCKGDDLY
eukprot:gene28457-24899_t